MEPAWPAILTFRPPGALFLAVVRTFSTSSPSTLLSLLDVRRGTCEYAAFRSVETTTGEMSRAATRCDVSVFRSPLALSGRRR